MNFKKGFTTGACAQAATKGSAFMLKNQKKINIVKIELPNKEKNIFLLKQQKFNKNSAYCCVIKDAGDEKSDVTSGLKICCEIKRNQKKKIILTGGKGVGKVTNPGLPVKVGAYAINPVPKKFILKEVKNVFGSDEGLTVKIIVPAGEKVAPKTFNPKLGIKGGISIIGTTGIVLPKSKEAYKASLSLEVKVAKAKNIKVLYLASGYLGEKLFKNKFKIKSEAIIKFGDYVGFILEQCVHSKVKNVVIAGHIGKLVKVAAGIFNTHSQYGDARLETLAAYAAKSGATQKVVAKILNLNTAEESIKILKENNLENVFNEIAKIIVLKIKNYTQNKLNISCILLSLRGEILGSCPAKIKKENKWEKFI